MEKIQYEVGDMVFATEDISTTAACPASPRKKA
jgi:hypothetical protein